MQQPIDSVLFDMHRPCRQAIRSMRAHPMKIARQKRADALRMFGRLPPYSDLRQLGDAMSLFLWKGVVRYISNMVIFLGAREARGPRFAKHSAAATAVTNILPTPYIRGI